VERDRRIHKGFTGLTEQYRYSRPPRWIIRLFDLIARSEEQRTISGDAEELYAEFFREKGRLRAVLWYAGQILSACPLLLFNSLYWRIFMFLNYLKITLRNIRRQKVFSFINIAGLAIGIAACVLIMLWVQDELSYDRFHENAPDLYAATFSNGSKVTPTALGPFLKAEYPEVTHTSRFSEYGRNLLKFKNTEIYESGGVMVDPDFLQMFTIPFLSGDPHTALDDPNSILLSERLAKKLFGTQDPTGQILVYNVNNSLKVTGVFEDYPDNSHMEFEYILPLELAGTWGRELNTWAYNNIQTYVLIEKNTPAASVDRKISNVVERHRPQDQRPLSLQPILRLHLNPFNHSGNPITYVYLFSAMAFFILLIACINFINLTTAKSTTRAREIGIRKTVGAYRTHLVRQFFGESMFLTVISSAAGICMAALFLPWFNSLAGKAFTWDFLIRQNVLLGIFAIILLTVIISGSYPAFFLSRFQPVHVLKDNLTAGKKGTLFRKALVVLQFSLSVLLILCTMMIFRQVHFLKDHEVGYDKGNVVIFGIGGRFIRSAETIKSELLSNPNIMNMTLMDVAPYRWMSNAGVGDVHWEGKTVQQVKMVVSSVDYDYLETFGLEMAQGRYFSEEYATDASDGFVINEAAVRAMEMEDPVGKSLKIWDFDRRIIGVVKDYHFESLHSPIIPMALSIDPNGYGQACIRISGQNVSETLVFLETKWKEIYPEYPFEYSFLDERLQNLYSSESSIGKLVTVFTGLALFISCLGIFGLSSYTAERRKKEIGIRRVLGASVANIFKYISREFVILVLIANVIIWPLAYFIINRWLQQFAFRIDIGWWTFILSGLAVLVVSLVTVSWQILRAATSNPVDSLRYE